MDLNALKALDSDDLAALIRLAQDYRKEVGRDSISGFHHSARVEIEFTDALIAKLQAAL